MTNIFYLLQYTIVNYFKRFTYFIISELIRQSSFKDKIELIIFLIKFEYNIIIKYYVAISFMLHNEVGEEQ